MSFAFPNHLRKLPENLQNQEATLREVAQVYADVLEAGGLVHVYANGHSRIAVEEMVIRMGALTGFHALLCTGLANFTDVTGVNGIRVNQAIERVEGLGSALLDEVDIGPGEPLLVVSATGQTQAAVDIALEWIRRYPDNPLIVLCCLAQARDGKPKHSSGKTLYHVAAEARRGHLLDNGMPFGDLSVEIEGETDTYRVCPLSSIGALSVVQSLNELTLRELDRRGVAHPVLRNMHVGQTQVNYDAWLRDQRRRYARVQDHPQAVSPAV